MSMQIVEKSGEGLSRVYGVTVPASELATRLTARIAEVAPQMNVKGFRPGKVPAAHVRRLYGKALMGEVIEQTLNETTQKVLDDNKLRPAGQPDLKPSSDMDKVIAGGEARGLQLREPGGLQQAPHLRRRSHQFLSCGTISAKCGGGSFAISRPAM